MYGLYADSGIRIIPSFLFGGDPQAIDLRYTYGGKSKGCEDTNKNSRNSVKVVAQAIG